jgi:hypothetical protein
MKLPIAILAAALVSGALFADDPNTLTQKEKAEGWKLLFDGKTTNGWRAIEKDEMPKEGWSADDGTLHHTKGGGDIVTVQKFDDFDLVFEFKITPDCNSGVKYFIKDKREGGRGNVGHEYQILDDEKNEDAKVGPTHMTAALYDVIAANDKKKVNPVGDWNKGCIVVRGNHVEQWLNDAIVVEYDIDSEEMKALVAKSKFKNAKGWGDKIATPILLQDHGHEVWFRNIKIRELSK